MELSEKSRIRLGYTVRSPSRSAFSRAPRNSVLQVRESFCESGEGVRLPRERGRPPGKSGNFWGSLGNFQGSLGNFRGTSGLLLSSTVRELPGKSPKNFRGSSGNFRGTPGTSQKLGGA